MCFRLAAGCRCRRYRESIPALRVPPLFLSPSSGFYHPLSLLLAHPPRTLSRSSSHALFFLHSYTLLLCLVSTLFSPFYLLLYNLSLSLFVRYMYPLAFLLCLCHLSFLSTFISLPLSISSSLSLYLFFSLFVPIVPLFFSVSLHVVYSAILFISLFYLLSFS